MPHDSEDPNASGNWGKELGVNTIPIYFDMWKDMENPNDTFSWDTTIPSNTQEYRHRIARIGILRVLAWSGDKIPDWVDPGEINTTFKDEYQEFIQTAIGELQNRGITVDAYGFHVASGVYDDVDDWTVVQAVLNDFTANFTKQAYLRAVGYPADNSDNLPFTYPRLVGYSEEWQSEQYVATLAMLPYNPKVIDASLDLFDYQEDIWDAPVHWGLVQGDKAHLEACTNRSAFEAVKQYWQEHYR